MGAQNHSATVVPAYWEKSSEPPPTSGAANCRASGTSLAGWAVSPGCGAPVPGAPVVEGVAVEGVVVEGVVVEGVVVVGAAVAASRASVAAEPDEPMSSPQPANSAPATTRTITVLRMAVEVNP